MSSTLYQVSTAAIPILLAITVHEVAHGFVARHYGDPTAAEAGRLTLNPLKHIHPFGTVILPGLLYLSGLPPFGFARPVPVDFRRLANPKSDMVWVAAAGPSVNLFMAIASALLLNLTVFMSGEVQHWFVDMLQIGVAANLVLCVFNMIPLPPLDGGRVAIGLLPVPLARRLAGLERYGMLIIIGVLVIPAVLSSYLNISFYPVWSIIQPVIKFLYYGIMNLFLFVS
ncbi:MAG: site-2 protease family protein [Alphaproteobacteria bacterium]|nr:site-2 protease family protein [Alphaproteobacteria bacterium]